MKHISGCSMINGWKQVRAFIVGLRSTFFKFLSTVFLAAALALPIPIHAQGCTQCRDNTAATSPATQRAYRHAILLMSGAAATFFLVTLTIVKRNR
jgi:hypothetical protein